jgi:hypothetical protein
MHDDNFDVSGVRDVVKAARPIYVLLGQPGRLQVIYPDTAHDFPDTAREISTGFLDQILGFVSKPVKQVRRLGTV